jgi:hypothetical protein
VLTNRALEAGIAGRGLRQALAQFAKHADDNASAMRRLGIEIMDTEGNMRALHEIAIDASAAFGDVTDLEALTIMLEDMNVRGATAFALLVQNADEYKAAVEDISNSAGEATQMADIQQESLVMQIQRVKNALMAPFLLSDKVGEANDTLNEFTYNIKLLVDEFVGFFIIELENGTMKLNDYGATIKTFVVDALKEFLKIIKKFKKVFLETSGGLENLGAMLHLMLVPLNILMDFLAVMPAGFLKWIMMLKVMNSILPITHMWTMLNTVAAKLYSIQMIAGTMTVEQATAATWRLNLAMGMTFVAMASMLAIGYALGKYFGGPFLALIGAATGALLAWGMTWVFAKEAKKLGVYAVPIAIAAGAVMGAAVMALGGAIGRSMGNPAAYGVEAEAQLSDFEKAGGMRDSGGPFLGGTRMYESGGPTTEHGMAILQKGETIIPKTQNMLGGGGGITLNIHGDVYDSDNFAEKISEVLPLALRKTQDIGGI